ncbi:MAG: response regulator transcription factor [Chloroflexi bacterium]|nr:MAG: response regulator transcription factor [Chloroflexota bacterium]
MNALAPAASVRPIRVVLCDDHELVRRGLRSLLEDVPGHEVVGEAGDADSALRVVESLHPDVVVMDVRLPARSGIEACREIRSSHPETHVLMLTSFADEDALTSSIMAGASGYLLKQVRGNDLVGAIGRAAEGRSLLDPALTARVMHRVREQSALEGVDELTGQERRILDLVGEGLTNRQIAGRMGLAEKTVKNYVSNILSKLGLSRRTQAAAYVARRRPPDVESRHQPLSWD